jgi:hypothetical protein
MFRAPIHSIAAVFLAALLLGLSSFAFAFDSPLSDQAVREAYFLGQRHDDSLPRFLDKYTRYLPPPKTGPYVASMTFFTPFALVAQLSSQRTMGYSAQQAALDHRGQEESVRVIIQIYLTESYGALIPRPTGARSGSPTGYAFRPSDFWKDFDVQVFSEDKELISVTTSGEPTYLCSDNGGCSLTGATIHLEFLAKSFSSDSATIQVTPPEGDPVAVDFDLVSLR